MSRYQSVCPLNPFTFHATALTSYYVYNGLILLPKATNFSFAILTKDILVNVLSVALALERQINDVLLATS